jgi:hypothetical protein
MRILRLAGWVTYYTVLLGFLSTMKKHKFKYYTTLKIRPVVILMACVLLNACREKHVPVIDDVNPNYLVVDGFINTGSDSTIFRLTRTFKLENRATVAPERGAILQVEVEGGTTYLLPELSLKPGFYAVPTLSQDQTRKYRLRVRTKDSKEYLSDFVESKVSPPVTLTYDFKHGNLNIYTNTEDATGKSTYYNYNYVETWQYTAPLKSLLKVVNGSIMDRFFPQDDIWNCYRHVPSSKISIASTAALTEDRVSDNLLVDILPNSLKVRIEYSILVKQTVLTKAGFNFFETLRKNTEQVGSIFDSQPSQLFGNIHCTTNPAEVVVGFISAGTATEKRILLLAKDLPFPFIVPPPDAYCVSKMDTIDTPEEFTKVRGGKEYIPISDDPPPFVATKFFECVDCRLQGGTNIVPPYWKY